MKRLMCIRVFLVVAGLNLSMISSGCAMFGGSRGGNISAPDYVKPHVRKAMDTAVVGFREEHGIEMRWDWGKWDIKIVAKPVVEYRNGRPMIAANGPEGVAGAYFDQYTQTVYVPDRDMHFDTLVHELGHLLAYMNGYRVLDESAQGHHRMFARFFNRFRYGGVKL